MRSWWYSLLADFAQGNHIAHLLGCIPWIGYHMSMFIFYFRDSLFIGRHLRCVSWTFWQATGNYQSFLMTNPFFGKRLSYIHLTMLWGLWALWTWSMKLLAARLQTSLWLQYKATHTYSTVRTKLRWLLRSYVVGRLAKEGLGRWHHLVIVNH